MAWEQRIRFAFLLVHFIVCLLRMLGYFNKLFTDPVLILSQIMVLFYFTTTIFFFSKMYFFFRNKCFTAVRCDETDHWTYFECTQVSRNILFYLVDNSKLSFFIRNLRNGSSLILILEVFLIFSLVAPLFSSTTSF